jgi:hypothetical protein
MTFDALLISGRNFYYTNTYLALAMVAGLVIFFWLKPMAAFKMIGTILLFLLIIYFFSSLGESSLTGMINKKQMIDQTRGRLN